LVNHQEVIAMILETINNPTDLRQVPEEDLPKLVDELR